MTVKLIAAPIAPDTNMGILVPARNASIMGEVPNILASSAWFTKPRNAVKMVINVTKIVALNIHALSRKLEAPGINNKLNVN